RLRDRFAKDSLKDLQDYAAQYGGKCLSTEYINSNTKYLWETEDGYQWWATWKDLKIKKSWDPRGRWEKIANKRRKYSLKDLQKYAASKGGKVLALENTIYKNTTQKWQWQCSEGHIWSASWCQIFNSKTWCPKCQRKQATLKIFKHSLKDLQEYAHANG